MTTLCHRYQRGALCWPDMKSRFSKKRRIRPLNKSVKPSLPFPPGQLINPKSLPKKSKASGPLWSDYGHAIAVPGRRFIVKMRGRVEPPIPQVPPQEIDFDDGENQWQDMEMQENNYMNNPNPPIYHFDSDGDSNGSRERRRWQNKRQKAKQSSVWLDDVLPRVLSTYMEERARRKGEIPSVPPSSIRIRPADTCACVLTRYISVTLISWSCELRFSRQFYLSHPLTISLALEETNVRVCCRPAVDQLIECGFFPCSPIRPSIAADIDLLDFIVIASLQLVPNVTAWAEILETFWIHQGFQLLPKVSKCLHRLLGVYIML